jgi:hypothetical protein
MPTGIFTDRAAGFKLVQGVIEEFDQQRFVEDAAKRLQGLADDTLNEKRGDQQRPARQNSLVV